LKNGTTLGFSLKLCDPSRVVRNALRITLGDSNRYEVRHRGSGSLAPSCGEANLPFETILLMRPNMVLY